MKSILTTAILAAASLALAASAQAQTALNSQQGDLFIGFVATGGTGASQDYVIDAGSYANFENGAATLNLGNISADLASVFGSNYATRSDLYVGLFGSNTEFGSSVGSDPLNTTFVTKTVGTAAPTRKTNSTQAQQSSRYTSLQQAFNTNQSTQTQNYSTANSDVALIQNTSDTNSYASFQTPVTTNSFALGFSNSETVASATSGTGLSLYELQPTTGGPVAPSIGVLNFDGSNFSFSTVPEPGAAWAILPFAGLIGFARRRLAVRA